MGNRELGHFFIEEILANPSSMRTRIILLQPEVTRDRGPDRVSLKTPRRICHFIKHKHSNFAHPDVDI